MQAINVQIMHPAVINIVIVFTENTKLTENQSKQKDNRHVKVKGQKV